MSSPISPVGNTLLAAPAHEEYEHLVPALEPVTFLLGDVVHESDADDMVVATLWVMALLPIRVMFLVSVDVINGEPRGVRQ